jgi:cullin 3
MCILELFNDDSPSVTFERIRSETGVPEGELRRHLISLTTPDARVLVKMSKGKTIADEDEFVVNDKYKSPKIRNKIKLVTLKSAQVSPEQGGEVPEHVLIARRNMIDAAVVRIMKARKTLEHQSLVAETSHQLSARFTPKPQDIKARIENLIDRDYLSRDETNRQTYHYVA